jgi:hypothetical protein
VTIRSQAGRPAAPASRVAALEDGIVQRATITLNAIYEEDLLRFSYGFAVPRKPSDLRSCDLITSL